MARIGRDLYVIINYMFYRLVLLINIIELVIIGTPLLSD